jgi:hypothetical protein
LDKITAGNRPIDAISYLFMHDQILNEYNTDDRINGRTEWVVTFPTKRFYVNDETFAPFTSLWDDLGDERGYGACERVFLGFEPDEVDDRTRPFYDREERAPVPTFTERPPVVSPAPPIVDPPPDLFELCWETSIIEFVGAPDLPDAADPSEVLGSNNVTRIHTGDPLNLVEAPFGADFQSGWTRIRLDKDVDDDGNVSERPALGGLLGLPVTGFSINRFGGDSIPTPDGLLSAKFGGIFQHKGTRAESGQDMTPPTDVTAP